MGSRDRDHAHFSEIFDRGHVGTVPGNTPVKFEVRTFSRFRTVAFNAPKFTGSRDRDHAHFSEIFVRGLVATVPGNTLTRLSNLKFVPSAVFEL